MRWREIYRFEPDYANIHTFKQMFYITLMGHGRNDTTVARVIKTNDLDVTSVPSAELINGRTVNLFECPENIHLKIWKRLNKQDRLALLWQNMPRNKRANIVISMLAEAYGVQKFKWYEI